MKSTKLGILLIVIALIWAALMLAVSKSVGEDFAAIQHWFVAGWFATHMLILSLGGNFPSPKAEWQCVRRLFTGRGADQES